MPVEIFMEVRKISRTIWAKHLGRDDLLQTLLIAI